MAILFTNNASSTLASAITSTATSITLASGGGNSFPTISGGNYFYATLINTSNVLEIIKVTGRTADVLTVVRGQEGTTGTAYAIGDKLEVRVTAQGLTDILNNGGVQSVAGRTGAVTLSSADISGLGSLATKSTIASTDIGTTVNGYGTRTVSTGTPTGGSDGDIWYKV